MAIPQLIATLTYMTSSCPNPQKQTATWLSTSLRACRSQIIISSTMQPSKFNLFDLASKRSK